jgi:hypothetical protein
MKTFYQLSEQAKRHARHKLLTETATGQQQPASAMVTALQTAWDTLFTQNKAAIDAMKAQKLDTTAIEGLSGVLKNYAATMAQNEKKAATTPQPDPKTATKPAVTPATGTGTATTTTPAPVTTGS